MERSEYKIQWQKAQRFRKWLVKNAGVELGQLTADDVEMLRSFYDALPVVKGKVQTITLVRLLERASRLCDECDYELSKALQVSRDIEHLLKRLYRGEVRFTYVLQSRNEQQMVTGTLAGPVASLVRRRSNPHASMMQVSFWDVEAGQWRSMHVGDFVAIDE